MRRLFALALLFGALVGTPARAGAPAAAEWPVTEGTPGGWRYSPLADIRRENVARLRIAWTYQHGDVRRPWAPFDEGSTGTSFEATPIVAEGRLVFPTPFDRVIALDPETGKELWTFDPEVDTWRLHPNMMISRGVAHWRAPARAASFSGRSTPG